MDDPTEPRRAPGHQRLDVPAGLGVFASAVGVVVLAGWALDVRVMKCVFPGLVTMKPNAALAFVAAGSSLCAVRGGYRRAALGLAAGVVAVGGLTLFEYVSGVGLGIDEVLAAEPPGSIGSLHPGRMHPTTAMNFVLLGAALGLLAVGRWVLVAQALALTAASVAASALLGYVYGVREFVGLAVYNQMALHTTVGMLVLASGVLLSRVDAGLLTAVSGDTAGGLMARRLLPAAVFVPVLLNGLILLARHAGAVDELFGTAVRVIASIAVFVAFIGWNAHLLHGLDLERRRAAGGLRSANDALEARVAEQAAVEAELRASERRYQFLADTMPQIVWTARPDGGLDYYNRRWFDYTGMSFEQTRDWGWQPVLHPDDLQNCLERWTRSVRSGEVYEVEYRFKGAAEGSYRWHLGRAEPMRDRDGRVVQWVGTCTDIDDQKRVEAELRTAREGLEHRVRERTAELSAAVELLQAEVAERERAEAEMRRAKEVAEAATRAKSEFLANMSHEIRTPMNGILGMTGLALDTELSPRQREYLGLVRSSADALLTVLNDILDFSKIEAGKLDLDPAPFGLRDCLDDTLKALAIRARAGGLRLTCRVNPDAPEALVGDAGRLRQVVVNLVGNAIKFTERGGVVVTTEVSRGDGGAALLHVSVADTGIGIAAGKLGTIFEPFEQADGSTTRKYGGTGLGLAISAKLVALMGGRIWVESEPGRGSTFHFTAALRECDGRAPAKGPAAAAPVAGPGASARRLRVLLAEDNPVNRLVAVRLLERRGHEVVVAADGREALGALEGSDFDLVLMDVHMPVMGGFEATARVRAREGAAGRHTPIVAMTACAMKGDRERCLAAGMDGYVSKPVSEEALWKAIDAVIPDRGADPGVLDEKAILARMGGDGGLVAELAGLFLEDSARLLREVGEAVGRADAPALKLAAHALKGSLSHFDARAAYNAAYELEEMAYSGDVDGPRRSFAGLVREMDRIGPTMRRLAGNPTTG